MKGPEHIDDEIKAAECPTCRFFKDMRAVIVRHGNAVREQGGLGCPAEVFIFHVFCSQLLELHRHHAECLKSPCNSD